MSSNQTSNRSSRATVIGHRQARFHFEEDEELELPPYDRRCHFALHHVPKIARNLPRRGPRHSLKKDRKVKKPRPTSANTKSHKEHSARKVTRRDQRRRPDYFKNQDQQLAKKVLRRDHSRGSNDLLNLPVEVRENIFKCLLTIDEPIRVRQGWTKVYPRCRPGLQTSILRTCDQFYTEGTGILYGQNTFLYLVRDAGPVPIQQVIGITPSGPGDVIADVESNFSEDEFQEHESDGEFGGYDPDGCEQEINIKKFGYLFRKIHLVAEANRSGPAYRETTARAIETFTTLYPRRANIHTITIEISPLKDHSTGRLSFVDYFFPSSCVMQALRKLPRQFIEVLVHTHVDIVSLDMDMRYAARIRRSNRGEEDMWKDDALMLKNRAAKARQAYAIMNSLALNIRREFEQTEEQLMDGEDDGDSLGDEDLVEITMD
jgi:hypothetical protein